jgi:hypothetical protein
MPPERAVKVAVVAGAAATSHETGEEVAAWVR